MTRARPPGPRAPRPPTSTRRGSEPVATRPATGNRPPSARRPSTFEDEPRRNDARAPSTTAPRVRLARPTTPAEVSTLIGRLGLEGNQPLSDRLRSFQRARGLAPDGLAGPAVLRLVGASNRQLPEAVSRALVHGVPENEARRPLSARGTALAQALGPLGPHATLDFERFEAEPTAIVRALTSQPAPPQTFAAGVADVLGQVATGTSSFPDAERRATSAVRFFAGV